MSGNESSAIDMTGRSTTKKANRQPGWARKRFRYRIRSTWRSPYRVRVTENRTKRTPECACNRKPPLRRNLPLPWPALPAPGPGSGEENRLMTRLELHRTRYPGKMNQSSARHDSYSSLVLVLLLLLLVPCGAKYRLLFQTSGLLVRPIQSLREQGRRKEANTHKWETQGKA